MPINEEVVARAEELADVMHARRRALIDRRNELARELKALDTELARPDDADERLGTFRPKRNGACLCPYCWMYDRAERPLCLVERGLSDAKVDLDLIFFRCSSCGNAFTESCEKDPRRHAPRT